MKQRAVMGKTLGFIQLGDIVELREKLSKLPKDFTGELTGVTISPSTGKEEEFAILISKGKIIVSVLEDKPVNPRDLVREITRRQGYMEIVEYTDDELELELKYRFPNTPRLEGEETLEDLVEAIQAPTTQHKEEEQAPEPKPVAEAPQRGGEEEKKAEEQAGGATAERVKAVREAVADMISVDSGFVGKISQDHSRAYHKILMVLREKSSTIKRLRGISPEEAVREAVKLAQEGYTGLHVRAGDREALIILDRNRLCLALERSTTGIRVLDDETIQGFLSREEEIEYVFFPIEPKYIDELVPECRSGEAKEGEKKSRKGLLGALRGIFSS